MTDDEIPVAYVLYTTKRDVRVSMGDSFTPLPGEALLAVQRRSGPPEITEYEKGWYLTHIAKVFPLGAMGDDLT